MRLTVAGLVVDELGNVLLVRRDGRRSWGAPAGQLPAAQLPDAAVAQAIEAQTGLKTLPVRLVGLYFRPGRLDGYLHFLLRCLVRGGTLAPGREIDAAAYFAPDKLPRPLDARRRQRLIDGLSHIGGAPHSRSEHAGLLRWLAGRKLPDTAATDWKVNVVALVPDLQGAIHWVEMDGRHRLPLVRPADDETPWAAATRAAQQQAGVARSPVDLVAVAGYRSDAITLVFRAPAGPGGSAPRFPLDAPPAAATEHDRALIAAALSPGPTHFMTLPAADA